MASLGMRALYPVDVKIFILCSDGAKEINETA
jgi:hypothetical protein